MAGTHQAACELNAPWLIAVAQGVAEFPDELGMLKIDAANI